MNYRGGEEQVEVGSFSNNCFLIELELNNMLPKDLLSILSFDFV